MKEKTFRLIALITVIVTIITVLTVFQSCNKENSNPPENSENQSTSSPESSVAPESSSETETTTKISESTEPPVTQLNPSDLKKFTQNEFSISLPKDYIETSYGNFYAVYGSSKCAVFVLKESKSALSPSITNIKLYANAVITQNKTETLNGVVEANGHVYFEYDFVNPTTNQKFRYTCYAIEGNNAFYLVEFASQAYEETRPHYETLINTVEISNSVLITSKKFTKGKFSIMLTSEFAENEYPGFTAVYNTAEIACYVLEEKFTSIPNSESYSAKEYAQLVIQTNKLTTIGEIQEKNGLVFFEYKATVEGATQPFRYIAYTFKSGDSFYLIQFATYESIYEKSKPIIESFAMSIEIS